jgi:hypothetical protein
MEPPSDWKLADDGWCLQDVSRSSQGWKKNTERIETPQRTHGRRRENTTMKRRRHSQIRENNVQKIRVSIEEEKGEEEILGGKTESLSELLLITLSREDQIPELEL